MFCNKCGAESEEGVRFCPYCGATMQQNNDVNGAQQGAQTVQNVYQPTKAYNEANQKSKLVAGLLQIFLGCFGVGRFYLGYTSIGVAQLLVCTVGGFFTCGIASIGGIIWTLVDGILILCDKVPNDANGVPLKE